MMFKKKGGHLERRHLWTGGTSNFQEEEREERQWKSKHDWNTDSCAFEQNVACLAHKKVEAHSNSTRSFLTILDTRFLSSIVLMQVCVCVYTTLKLRHTNSACSPTWLGKSALAAGTSGHGWPLNSAAVRRARSDSSWFTPFNVKGKKLPVLTDVNEKGRRRERRLAAGSGTGSVMWHHQRRKWLKSQMFNHKCQFKGRKLETFPNWSPPLIPMRL